MDAHNRTKKVRTKTNFKLSNATLDLETIAEDEGSDSVAIWVKTNKKNTLLATLNQNVPQAQIDVAFGKGQSVEFYVRSHINNAAVYLSGYEIYDDDADLSVDADTIQMSSFNGSPSTSAVKMQSLQTNTSSGQSKLNQNRTYHFLILSIIFEKLKHAILIRKIYFLQSQNMQWYQKKPAKANTIVSEKFIYTGIFFHCLLITF